jgi:signal transduction histidine kinase
LRIVQEFIQNSIKHSGCKVIGVKMDATENSLIITLQDDGKGFDMEEALHTGSGLNNIRRRIQTLKGSCNFQSEKRKGTKLDISMPLQTNSAEI